MTDNTHNGDHNIRPISGARKIMQDPAGASGAEPQPAVITSPHISDPGVAKLLDNLPGLVGALDSAIKDTAGQPHAFMLMIFTPGIALHACNTDAAAAQHAAAELVKSWETSGRGEERDITQGAPRVIDAEGPPANDEGSPGAAG